MWHLLTLPNQLTYLHLFLFFFHQIQLFWGAFQMIWLLSQCNWISSINSCQISQFPSQCCQEKYNTNHICNFPFLAATYEKVFKSLKSILIIYFILSSISEYSAKLSTNYFLFTINLWVLPWYIPWLRRLIHLMHLLINKYLLNATVYQNHLGSVNSMVNMQSWCSYSNGLDSIHFGIKVF